MPIAVIAVVAFAAGIVCAGSGGSPEERAAKRFAAAWSRGDYARMYAELTPATQRRITRSGFTEAYRKARTTATATGMRTAKPRERNGRWHVEVEVQTRIFSTVTGEVELPLERDGDSAHIKWQRSMTFPGVPAGATLTRSTTLPRRAAILARDGTPLASSASRTSALGAVAAAVVGQLGAIPPERAERLRALGWPAGAQVGVSGLERVFDERLAGAPGGSLRAGDKRLAVAVARPDRALRTTISPPIQEAVNAALAGRLGGIVAIDPGDGAILGFAGIAFSGLQPPGSTFKLVTLTGVLEAGIASPRSTFPVQTAATLSGVQLQNANKESCGGTLAVSFANSCNSVFAPLGVKLGAKRLVAIAERLGFNHSPGIPGAATSTIPAADEIGDDLALGSSAIGQGRVQATALQMATVAATIARRGIRPVLTLDLATAHAARRRDGERAMPARVARTVERLMLGVVGAGTGTAAAIAGVKVAGKTGTAELKSTQTCQAKPDDPESCPDTADPTDTDAWFAAYAPAGRPRIAVGVLLVGAGAGGDTAAPAARDVLIAGLKR